MRRETTEQLIIDSIASVRRIINENRNQGLNHTIQIEYREQMLTDALREHAKGDDERRDEFLRRAVTGLSSDAADFRSDGSGENHGE